MLDVSGGAGRYLVPSDICVCCKNVGHLLAVAFSCAVADDISDIAIHINAMRLMFPVFESKGNSK